jgi:Cu(I)/Ag(I) efflux system membrane fusion protein
MKSATVWIVTVVVSAAIGAALVYTLDPRGSAGAGSSETAVAQEARYICPMHADIVSVGPGECSICGMDLVPVAHEEPESSDEGELPAVHIAPEMVHNLGVRAVAVGKRSLERRIDTVGYVEYDRARLRHIYPPADGQIENLALSSEGERVKKGQFLFQLFSPMLGSSADKTYAQQDGVVVELNVIEGTYVRSTMRAITVADLDSVWVLADVFEEQASWVRPGQGAEVRLPYVSGRVWKGRVEYVYPNLDPETRTLKARLRFDNPGEVLKPNMHAEVAIECGSVEDVLAAPRDAVIETEHEHRVILALGEGRFRPRRVETGLESGDWIEIVAGIDVGDRVVVSSQFLIDSEANLRVSLSRMTEADDDDDSGD